MQFLTNNGKQVNEIQKSPHISVRIGNQSTCKNDVVITFRLFSSFDWSWMFIYHFHWLYLFSSFVRSWLLMYHCHWLYFTFTYIIVHIKIIKKQYFALKKWVVIKMHVGHLICSYCTYTKPIKTLFCNWQNYTFVIHTSDGISTCLQLL